MARVYTIPSTNWLFSAIISDEEYNYFNTLLSSTTVVANYAGPTSIGDDIIANSSLDLCASTVFVNVEEYVDLPINLVRHILPLLNVVYLNETSASYHNTDYDVNNGRKVRIRSRYYQTIVNLLLSSYYLYNDVIVSNTNSDSPFGTYGTRATGDTTPNRISISIPVITEDYNRAMFLFFYTASNGNLELTKFIVTSTDLTRLTDYFNGLEGIDPGPTPSEDDPYEPGGETDTGGGTGDFDNTSVDIEIPQPPTLTVDNTGFISLYSPTMVELRALASYLWSSSFDIDTFKKIFSDPISTILGLTIVPVAPGLDASRTVILGNVDTGVVMQKVSNQYIRFDCGTLNITEYWGGYLDYSPYTRAEIYLPFIGTKPINIDDIMGKSVHLVYNIDLLSGACCAMLSCGGTVLYSFVGQCASSIPITGNDMTQVINGILSVVGAGAGAFVATGNPGISAMAAVGSLASNVINMKSHVEKSGSLGGTAGMLGVRTPYLILTRPKQALPAAQNIYTGYPSYISGMLGDFSGYTEVQTVHLRDTSATQEEKAEIERLLKEGVII